MDLPRRTSDGRTMSWFYDSRSFPLLKAFGYGGETFPSYCNDDVVVSRSKVRTETVLTVHWNPCNEVDGLGDKGSKRPSRRHLEFSV